MQVMLDIFYGYMISISIASILAIIWIITKTIADIKYKRRTGEHFESEILDYISLGILIANPIILLTILVIYILSLLLLFIKK